MPPSKNGTMVKYGMSAPSLMERMDILKMVGPGWDFLLNPLITMCIEQGATISQVKEKYGGLRFYIHGGNKKLHRAIEKAEEKSLTICERCGASGRAVTIGHGWAKTLCERHFGKKEEPYEDDR